MRVITGSAKGVKLDTLAGDAVRPTGDLIKGAIFNSIQFDIEGRRVLDLFCGSGQLGIEALSRGAKNAVFVDSSRKSISVTDQNIKKTGFTSLSCTVTKDYADFLKGTTDTFDIVLLDPPYNKGLIQKAMPYVTAVTSKFGTIVCEHDAPDELDETYGEFTRVKVYKHGRIRVSVYKAVLD